MNNKYQIGLNRGVDHFDVLINAGMLINKPFSETTTADFEAVYSVNVFGGTTDTTLTTVTFCRQSYSQHQ